MALHTCATESIILSDTVLPDRPAHNATLLESRLFSSAVP